MIDILLARAVFPTLRRSEEAAVGHPVSQAIRPLSHGFQLRAVAHVKSMTAPGKDVRLNRKPGVTILREQAHNCSRGTAIVVGHEQERGGCIGGNRHRECPAGRDRS